MSTPSAPVPEYGAPSLPITSTPTPTSRGRCATCTQPIRDDQDARHVKAPYRYATEPTIGPLPYEHTHCPNPPQERR